MDRLIVVLAVAACAGVGVALIVAGPSEPVNRRSAWRARVRIWLDETGLVRHSAAVAFWACVGISALVSAIIALLIPVPVVLPVALMGALLVCGAVLEGRRTARRRSARALWPDIIDSLRSSLRSGATVAEAFIDVADRVPERWRSPWHECAVDLQRGVSFEVAARRLKRVVADPTADVIIESLIVAREVGGTELPRIVATVADTVRAEARIRNEVRSRQSWVRHAARLGVSAPWIVLAMIVGRPETRDAFTTPMGSLIIVAGFGATVVAYYTMAGISTIPEQQCRLASVVD